MTNTATPELSPVAEQIYGYITDEFIDVKRFIPFKDRWFAARDELEQLGLIELHQGGVRRTPADSTLADDKDKLFEETFGESPRIVPKAQDKTAQNEAFFAEVEEAPQSVPEPRKPEKTPEPQPEPVKPSPTVSEPQEGPFGLKERRAWLTKVSKAFKGQHRIFHVATSYAMRAHSTERTVYTGSAAVAEETDIAERHVKTERSRLVEAGFLVDTGERRGRAIVYRLA